MKYQFLLPIAASILIASCKTAEPPSRFNQTDLNADGKLSIDEVNEYFVSSVFVSLDTNKDKKLTREEWNPAKVVSDERKFVLRDTNKDGVVTIEEAVFYAKKVGTYNQAVKEADTNKDGYLSEAEAMAYYAKAEGQFR